MAGGSNGDWSLRILMGGSGWGVNNGRKGGRFGWWILSETKKKRTANEYVKHFSLKVPLFYY